MVIAVSYGSAPDSLLEFLSVFARFYGKCFFQAVQRKIQFHDISP